MLSIPYKGIPACPLLEIHFSWKSSHLFYHILSQTTDLLFVLRNSDMNYLSCPSGFLCPVQEPTPVSSLLEPSSVPARCPMRSPPGGHWRLDKQSKNLFLLPSLSDVTMHNFFHVPAPKGRKWIRTPHTAQVGGEGKNKAKCPLTVRKERQNIIFVNNGAMEEIICHIMTWD